MCAKSISSCAILCVFALKLAECIYDPNDEISKKPFGIKSISWQGDYGNRTNVQVHHNYSRVNVQKPKDVPNYESQQELGDLGSGFDQSPQSSTPEDFGEQQRVTDNSGEATNTHQVYNAHTYGNRPVESERYVGNSQMYRKNRQFSYQRPVYSYNIGIRNPNDEEYSHSNLVVKKTKIQIYSQCPQNATGQFVYELSCSQFLNCWKGRGIVQNCAPGTLFNPKTLECDYIEKVHCVTGPRKSMLIRNHEDLTAENQASCPEGFSGLIPHYTDCSKFINCNNGAENIMDCAPGTLFDSRTNTCDYPEKAICVNSKRANNGAPDGYSSPYYTNTGTSSGYTDQHQPGSHQNFQILSNGYNQESYYKGNGENRGWQAANYGSKSQSQTFGRGVGYSNNQNSYSQHGNRGISINDHISSQNQQHWQEQGHNQWHGSSSGNTNQNRETYSGQTQDTNGQWNSYNQNTENPDGYSSGHIHGYSLQSYGHNQNVDGGYQEGTQSYGSSFQNQHGYGGGQNFNANQGYGSHHHGYYGRQHHGSTSQTGQNYGGYSGRQENSGNNYQRPSYSENSGSSSGSGYTSSNLEAKCPPDGNGLYPHPSDCSKFLNCANGIAYVQDCAPGTLFSPDLKVCDFPYRVECSSRPTVESTPIPDQDQTNVQDETITHITSETPYYHSGPINSYGRREPNQYNPQDDYQTSGSKIRGHYITKPPKTAGNKPISSYGNVYVTNYGSKRPSGTDQNQVEDIKQSKNKWKNSGWSNGLTTVVEPDYVYEYDDDIIIGPKQDDSIEDTSRINACSENQYTCSSNQCVLQEALCNGIRDCSNGRDESNCRASNFTVVKNNKLAIPEHMKFFNTTVLSCSKLCLEGSEFKCVAFNYRKHDGVCYLLDKNVGQTGALIGYQIFDYYEMSAYSINCSKMFRCSNNKCINYNKICDGIDDCGDRMDERHCSAESIGYNVRLVGADRGFEGLVEVTAVGKTGYICDDQFGLRDADVVCRELGFSLGALEVKGNSYFSQGIKDINNAIYLMDDVSCLGNETTLRDCDFSGWGVHNCMAQEFVGVTCKTPEDKCPDNYWQCDTEGECIPLAFLCDNTFDCKDSSDEGSQHCDAPVEYRLSNGSNSKEGRLEVRYHGTWGTVCDDDFNEDAAKVVCASLGYQGSAQVKKDGYFGPGQGPIWLDQVYCQGNESVLQECVHWDWGENNCEHSEDVGIVCSDFPGHERASKVAEDELKPLPLSVFPETCGYRKDNIFARNDDVHFRVVKGSKANKGEYPWQASIRVKGKTKLSHWCGAVVISSRFVLTAAHCVVGFPKGAYVVVAGDYNVDELEGTEQTAFVEEIYPHEDFRKGQKMNNDIALVKLKGDGFAITNDVQPICLPDGDLDYEQSLNCTISGFGSVQTGKSAYSHDLRAGWIPLQPKVICKMPHIYGSAITEGMICAGSLDEGVDACDGDSGGPLACLHDGLFTLYGLTSWGQHCGYANKPGVYVKVSHYRQWIDEHMEKYK